MRLSVRPSQGRSIFLAVLLLLVAAPSALAEQGDAYADWLPPRTMIPGETSGFRLPFEPGTEVRVSQGWMTKGSHQGRTSRYAYDFALPMNTPVVAAAPGVVAFTRTGNTACGGKKMTRFANVVTINHADGSATQYGHLATVDVEVGQVVEAGQVIGRSGRTGRTSCEPHLHFARQYQGDLVTRSIPIYFKGFEGRRLYAGTVLSADRACGGPLAKAAANAGKNDKNDKDDEDDEKTKDGEPEATDGFCAAYFSAEFAGPALFWRDVKRIDVDRKKGGPGGYWLDAPQPHSARWTGRFEFAPWWYTFRIEATGAVRLTLDGIVIAEDWVDEERPRVVEVRQRLRAGLHTVEVEHFTTRERDRIDVDWSPLLIDR